MRAHQKPSTGRFLSRDPAGVDIERPETFNEYTFALSNPWVYRDPTGAFTVTGLTVGMSVNDLLGAIRTAAVQYIKDRAKDELGQAAGDFLVRFLSEYLPMNDSLFSRIKLTEKDGRKFERLGSKFICRALEELSPAALNSFWLEVGLKPGEPSSAKTGQAVDNGSTDCKNLQFGIAKPIGIKSADFIFSPQEPLARAVSTFIVGDFKISAKSAFDRQRRGQAKAFFGHARNYGFRIVVYVTFFPGEARNSSWAREKAKAFGLIQVFFLSLRKG